MCEERREESGGEKRRKGGLTGAGREGAAGGWRLAVGGGGGVALPLLLFVRLVKIGSDRVEGEGDGLITPSTMAPRIKAPW